MTILQVLILPNPILKLKSNPVDNITDDIISFSKDLVETMKAHTNCVGLAAPQVGKNIRIISVDVSLYPKKYPNHGPLIIINPVITHYEGTIFRREGCLSIPDFTANIIRHSKIIVEGLNIKGKSIKIESIDFESIVLQHEIDHLDGILFLDRVRSLKTDIFRRKR